MLALKQTLVYPESANTAGSVRSAGPSSGFFQVDNELIKLYGRHIGPVAIAVYGALAMHAGNASSSCFPAQETLAEELGIGSRNTLSKALQRLKEAGLIDFETVRGSKGRYVVTAYTLLPLVKEAPRAEFEHGPRAEFEHGPRAEFEQKQYPQRTIPTENKKNQPTEPTREEIALEADPVVGFSLREEGEELDPAADQPVAGGVIQSLRQKAQERGFNPGHPTKELIERLSSAPMTLQGEVIAYVANYTKPIKNFWGWVKWCVDNPEVIKNTQQAPADVDGSPEDVGGDRYACIPTPQPHEPEIESHVDEDLPEEFLSIRDALLQKFNADLSWREAIGWSKLSRGLKDRDITLVQSEGDQLVLKLRTRSSVDRLNSTSLPKGLKSILDDHSAVWGQTVRFVSDHEPIKNLRTGGFIPAHTATQARSLAMPGHD